MSHVTYHHGAMTIIVDGLEDVSKALGSLKGKTPAAAKVAINAAARQARKSMIAAAKARYAVNARGLKHLKPESVKLVVKSHAHFALFCSEISLTTAG